MQNPLFDTEWTTPFGTPPFDKIKTAHFAPALHAGMEKHNKEIQAIAKNTEAPTFENTIEALENAGSFLSRVAHVFYPLTGTMMNDELEAIQTEFAPIITRHYNTLWMNEAIFKRVDTLYNNREKLALRSDQAKLLRDYHRDFIRTGAKLPPAQKEEVLNINSRLSELHTLFGENVRKENAAYALIVDKKEELAGLPDDVIAMAAKTAKEKGHEGKWVFTLVRASINPFLKFSQNRELRKEIYSAYISRGSHGDNLDNRESIKEIVLLRAKRAEIMGYKSHAHYQLEENMAKTPEAALSLVNKLWDGSLKLAKAELVRLEALLKKDLGAEVKIQPWDWSYYSEKIRASEYGISEEELKPYFQVDAVMQGAFDTATQLFGITFREITEQVSVYHPEVKVFEVKDKDGEHVGVFYVDYFPRESKRGGAWMNEFREQRNLGERVRPIIANTGNFPIPTDGKPALLGWSEVTTLFHEFGHGLHGLLSDVKYPSQSGTNVKRDYVEFPSQLLENWAVQPQVIKKYARHYKTGEALPNELIEKLKEGLKWGQGFGMTEVVAAALLDLKWHSLSSKEAAAITDVEAFDKAYMEELGLMPEIAPRYHSPYFQHIFAGGSYASGYYVYLWAQVLEADTFHAFEESGDIFNPQLAAKLLKYVFEAGSSDEEMTLYHHLLGREPDAQPLLKKLGIVEPK